MCEQLLFSKSIVVGFSSDDNDDDAHEEVEVVGKVSKTTKGKIVTESTESSSDSSDDDEVVGKVSKTTKGKIVTKSTESSSDSSDSDCESDHPAWLLADPIEGCVFRRTQPNLIEEFSIEDSSGVAQKTGRKFRRSFTHPYKLLQKVNAVQELLHGEIIVVWELHREPSKKGKYYWSPFVKS